MPRYIPFVLLAGCIAALILLYRGLQPAETGHAPVLTHKISLRIVDRRLAKGPEELNAFVGDTAHISVMSNSALSIHLHGYERHLDVQADVPSELIVPLVNSGRFELEVHEADGQFGHLAVITVQPRT